MYSGGYTCGEELSNWRLFTLPRFVYPVNFLPFALKPFHRLFI